MTDLLKNRMLASTQGFAPPNQGEQPSTSTNQPSTQGTGTNNQSVSGLLGKRKLAEQNGPTPRKSNAIVVTSTSGKKYTLTGEQVDWIRDRYKADWAGTYGYDDDDQQAKTYGRMSAAIRSTYGDSNVDRQLAGLKLPSERYLEKYLEAYDNWHTGGVRQVFGDNVSDDAWTKIGELYRQDWVYEDTDEDRRRKSAGLMPSALAAKYSDTELDDDLLARGLPSYADLKNYATRYSNYLGIDSFYRDVSSVWTTLRMRGWKNDDTEYTDEETGETHTGKVWYEKAFYDTLEREDDGGGKVYGSIYGLLKFDPKTESTSDEDYGRSRYNAIVGDAKGSSANNDYSRWMAFSYTDFMGKYEDYFTRDYADMDLTLSNGSTMKIADYIEAVDAEADRERDAAYFTVDRKDPASVGGFIANYLKDFPDRDYSRMFLDLKEHGADDATIKEVKRQLRRQATTREQRSAIDDAYRAFKATPMTPSGKASPLGRSMMDFLESDPNTLASGIESYIQTYGGYTSENIRKAMEHYLDIGVSEAAVHQAGVILRERYANGEPADNADPDILDSFDNYHYKDHDETKRVAAITGLADSAAAYIKARRDDIANNGSVDRAMTEITDAIDQMGEGVTPDAMFSLARGIADQPWASATTARRALVDLGFSMDGDFSGDALRWTAGWTDADKASFISRLKSEMGSLDDVEHKGITINSSLLDRLGRANFGNGALGMLISQAATFNELSRKEDGSYSAGYGIGKLEDLLTDLFTKGEGVPLDVGEYDILREWMDDMVSSGQATPMECFNALCSMGYQDEIEAYDSDAFHEAIFKENMVPALFEQSDSLNRSYWKNAPADERLRIADSMWDDMTPEKRADMFANYDWKLDSNIYRTTGQTFRQQFLAVIPSVVTGVASGAIGFADMVATAVSGKDDLWGATKEIMSINNEVTSFGNVSDSVHGSDIARISSDAAAELLKMYMLGSIGGAVGESFGSATGLSSVASGSAASPAVQKIAGLGMSFVKSSPFVVNAMGGGFSEAKMMGARNGEAIAYGVVTGTLEGVLEGANFDNLWGKVLGQGSFGKMLIDGGKVWKNAGVVAKARIVNMLVAGLGEATEETASYLAETLWKTKSDWLGGTGWGKDTEWSLEDWAAQAGMGFLTGFLGAAIGAGNVNEVSIMQDYYENLGVIKGGIIDYSIAQKYWENATDAQREAWRNGAVQMLSLPDFANMMMQMDNCYRANAAADETYQQVVEKWDAKVSNLTAEMDAVKAQIMALDPYNAEDAEKLAKLHTRMRGLQAQMKALQEQRTAAVAKAASDRDTRKDNAAAQLSVLQSKYAEHYAALYLRNESAANSRDYDTLNANHARARQNGDTVDLTAEAKEASFNTESESGSRMELPDHVVADGQNERAVDTSSATTDPAARQTGTRILTDNEISQIHDIANRAGFRYGIDFINDPNNVGDAWFDKSTGRITINQANITAAEAEDLVSNPGFWLLRHEWSHYIEGSKYYSEYLDTVSRLQMNELGTGGYNAAIQHIIQERAQKGISLGETAEEQRQNARMELAAKYAQGRLFTSQESIDAFVREQKGVAARLYNWLQYVIDRGKLRRQKNSAEARAILEAERMYAKAFRAANINPASITDDGGARLSTSDDGYANPFGLSSYTLKEERSIKSRPNNIIALSEKDIRDFFDNHIMKSENTQYRLYCGKISEDTAARIKENTGVDFDLTGASVVITSHLEKSHVDEAKEASRGQVQITGEILSKVPEAIRSFTSVEYDGETADGRHAFKFELDIDGKKIAVEYYSAGRNILTLQTIYGWANKKNPTATVDAEGTAPVRTSETTADSGSANTVAPKKSGVKSQNRRASTGLSYDDLLQQYGAKDQGMGPRARDIQVPERVSQDTRVSDFARSFLESNKAADDMVADLQQRIADGDWMSYTQLSNQEAMDRARSYIAQRQITQAQSEFHDMVKEGKYGAKTNAIGLQLLAEAANRGDKAAVLDIATDLQILATDSGQSVQIFSALKELGGVGSAWYMQKVVDRLNAKYSDQIADGKMLKITVDPALMQQLTEAQTTAEITKAEEDVAKYIGKQIPLTWADRLSAWRYFSMLANPITHLHNITGNLLMSGLNAAKDAVATGLERGFVKDQSQRAHAILTFADRRYWRGFARQSYEEQARNLSGGGKLGFETFVKQTMRSFDTKWLDSLAKLNFKALEGEDVMFIRRAYQKALMEYMKAQGYTLNEDGQAGKINAKGEFVEMSNAEKTSAVEWASQQAWKATFRDASAIATLLNKISQHDPASRLVIEGLMPFKRTPVNIAKRSIEYSPIGIIMGTTQLLTSVKNGKMTAAQAVDNIASGITGTAIMAVGYFLAKSGHLRAGGEEKDKYETYLEDTGDQTYSLKFGDVSINLSSIAPATIPLFMGAALYDVLENGGENFSLTDLTNMVEGALNPFMEMSFMSSINSALKTYDDNAVLGVGGNALRNYGSQYIPTIGGKIAGAIDTTVRSTKSDATSPLGGKWDYFLRSLAKKTPGATYALEPDVDVWGRTTENDAFGKWALNFANSFILPTKVKVTNRDAVDNELIRLVESTGNVDFLPSDGNKYFIVKGVKYAMNARQYTQYSQERGQASYAALKEVMRSAAYRQASDEEKAAMLEKALKAAQKQVNTRWKEILGALD